MQTSLTRAITDDEVATYARDGVVCLRGFFDRAWIDYLGRALDDARDNPGPMAVDATRGGTGRFYGETFLFHSFPALRRFVFESPAAAMAARLMGSRKINILFDQMLIKEPGTSTPTMWHHDHTYWPVAGDQVCTLWLALDPATRATGAMEFVAGSHRWGQRFLAKSFIGDGRYKEDLPPVPDIDAERDRHVIICHELEPGDCTIHHALLLHGAPGNRTTTTRRRGYVTRWCGDDVTYNPRPNLQPMLRDPAIPVGGPLDCDLFPVVSRV